ncbi:MAG TPA: hypothetical protein VMT20_22225 [Terriglobia bacterium]|nr:hypothetical protein [Terriglobia bacterium]
MRIDHGPANTLVIMIRLPKLKLNAVLGVAFAAALATVCAAHGQSASHTIQAPSASSTLPVRIEPKAQQILDRAIQALGGAAFLNAKTMTTHGTLGSGGGGIVYFDSQVQFPDKRRLTYGLAKKGKPIVVINNGDLGWEIDRMGTVSLDSEDLRAWRFNNRYGLENLLRLRIHEPGTLVQTAGVDFVDNVAVNVLDMVDATQNQIKLYLATQTGLPVRISYRKWNALVNDWDEYSDIYGNYGTYQGITIPRQISHLVNNRRASEVFRSSAEFNETYPPGIFDDPTAAK